MGEISFDRRKLKMLMRKKGYTQRILAREIGVSEWTMSRKINGYGMNEWEIYQICKILHISPEKIGEYFFAERTN